MGKKYNIIYADPPWQYKVYSKKGESRTRYGSGLLICAGICHG